MVTKVKISVCMALYNSESTLRGALDSVFFQNFQDWEIVLVNDGSSGKDEKGRSCKKIIRAFLKENKIARSKLQYLEHRNNLGLVEARRSAIQAANGDYIVILDCDDKLLPGALEKLYQEAVKSGADIVSARDKEGVSNPYAAFPDESSTKELSSLTELKGRQVFDGFLVNRNHKGFLWAKIIKKSLYLKAFSHIPFTKCVLAEDFLQYFFLSYEANHFVKLDIPVYDYSIGSGISTSKRIDSLSKWEQICTAANVFTIIFAVLKDEGIELSLEESEALKFQSRSYLKQSLLVIEERLSQDMKIPAKAILCDYWGEDFVKIMENAIEI